MGINVLLIQEERGTTAPRSPTSPRLLPEDTRKIFERSPYHTAVDEASMEPVIRGQGYQAQYVPTAIVYNKGPETLADFLRQRRRIYAGHLAVRDTLGYNVSTMSARKIFMILLPSSHPCSQLRPKCTMRCIHSMTLA